MGKYGMPYQGNKQKLADTIIDMFPEAPVFIDAFGGGGAISHCAALSGKFKTIIYNELNPLVYDAFNRVLRGDYDPSEWISREKFFRCKDTDGIIAICWSFNNNMCTYIFGKNKEEWKKSVHDWIFKKGPCPISDFECSSDDWNERRLAIQRELKKRGAECSKDEIENLRNQQKLIRLTDDIKNARVKTLEEFNRINELNRDYQAANLERYRRLEELERYKVIDDLSSITPAEIICSNKSYDEIDIPEGAVIYCDPPYRDVQKGYTGSECFDYEKYDNWLRETSKKHLIICSEYNMPDDFICVKEIKKHLSGIHNIEKSAVYKIEKLYLVDNREKSEE